MKKILDVRWQLRIFVAIEIAILLSGCGTILKGTPNQGSTELPPALTSTPVFPSPTSTVSPVPFLLTPSATPIPLDPNHWTLFTSPIDVLQSDVHHIDQAQNGTMWFGGFKIYRYDGKNWSVYDQKSIPVFRGHVIKSLAVTPNGTVWIGTESNEVVRFDGTSWTSHTVEDGGYRKNLITSIMIRKNGELCAISIEGMSCLNGDNWVRHPIVVQKTSNQVYVGNAVLTTTDEIWVPLGNGVLYHYDGTNWESSQVSSWICCLSANQGDSLWIIDHEGFGKLNPTNRKIDYQWAPALILEYTLAMKAARDGTVWFGTGEGYEVAHYINGSYITVDGQIMNDSIAQQESVSRKSFPFFHVSYIFQAMDGSMWFGTVGGIFRYK